MDHALTEIVDLYQINCIKAKNKLRKYQKKRCVISIKAEICTKKKPSDQKFLKSLKA